MELDEALAADAAQRLAHRRPVRRKLDGHRRLNTLSAHATR
jgi:hypothetical protein